MEPRATEQMNTAAGEKKSRWALRKRRESKGKKNASHCDVAQVAEKTPDRGGGAMRNGARTVLCPPGQRSDGGASGIGRRWVVWGLKPIGQQPAQRTR